MLACPPLSAAPLCCSLFLFWRKASTCLPLTNILFFVRSLMRGKHTSSLFPCPLNGFTNPFLLIWMRFLISFSLVWEIETYCLFPLFCFSLFNFDSCKNKVNLWCSFSSSAVRTIWKAANDRVRIPFVSIYEQIGKMRTKWRNLRYFDM